MSQAGIGFPSPDEMLSITGNSGGTITPNLLGGLSIVGDGVTVTTIGDPLTHTLTIQFSHPPFVYTNVAVTPYVVLGTDYYLSVNTSIISITVKLPDSPAANTQFVIKDRSGNAELNNIILTTVTGLVTIDGVVSYAMNTNYQSVNIVFNGSNYEIF